MIDRITTGARWVVGGLIAILLAGCGTTMSRVQTWEGEKASGTETAVLDAPGTVRVQSVNGQSMTSYFLEDLDLSYELLPGKNRIVFIRKTIWAKAARVEDGESSVHTVKTAPREVVIDARPGGQYRFEAPSPGTRKEAMATIDQYLATIVDADDQTLAKAGPVSTPTETAKAVAKGSDGQARSGPGNDLSTLDALKTLWKKASSEEKQKFLDWAFE